MRYLLIFIVSIFLFTACQSPAKNQEASPDAKRYPLRGKIVSVDKAKKKAAIAHEEIPGFMGAMTMDFPIRPDWIINDLQPGSDVRGELVVDDKADPPYWLENISVVSAPDANQSALPVNENFAQIGNPVPDFKLTNQDGKTISFNEFRGKALALTFIYSRCPLPEYCIAMSRNFSQAANSLQDSEIKDKARLLSISFDPENDTPQKLREYGLQYLGDSSKAKDFVIWQLAVGSDQEVRKIADFFGLHYEVDQNDKTLINHSLRTALISPDGKVVKIYPGNEWTSNELIKDMQSSLAATS